MKKLFNQQDFNSAKSRDLLQLECVGCHKQFFKTKNYIKQALSNKTNQKGNYCSYKCLNKTKETNKTVICSQCQKKFTKLPSQMRSKKSNRHFCSRSCSVTYNNLHKKHGTRRSKLEKWLEEQLTQIYPNLKIEYNQKGAISSELDVYIPSMKIAFEINGIYHYEPIHGQKKFAKIQNNDKNKFQQCIAKGISLCIIDSSSSKYFKPEKSQKYLIIITDIIDDYLANS